MSIIHFLADALPLGRTRSGRDFKTGQEVNSIRMEEPVLNQSAAKAVNLQPEEKLEPKPSLGRKKKYKYAASVRR